MSAAKRKRVASMQRKQARQNIRQLVESLFAPPLQDLINRWAYEHVAAQLAGAPIRRTDGFWYCAHCGRVPGFRCQSRLWLLLRGAAA